MQSHGLRETSVSENREAKETGIGEIHRSSGENDSRREVSSAEISAKAYERTVSDIVGEFGEVIPEEQKARIEMERERNKPTVLSREAYGERFPGTDPNVLGHYDSRGRIFMKEGSPEAISHVTTHEALHLTSYKETDAPGREVRTYRSGIRETVYDETGLREDRNLALNEGITELYALRELKLRGETASMEEVTAYPEARKAASELQGIVGKNRICEAYFGGNTEQLKNEVNRLNFGDETAWDRYSKCVDTVEFGKDEEQIRAARRELTLQHAIMLSCKEYET